MGSDNKIWHSMSQSSVLSEIRDTYQGARKHQGCEDEILGLANPVTWDASLSLDVLNVRVSHDVLSYADHEIKCLHCLKVYSVIRHSMNVQDES